MVEYAKDTGIKDSARSPILFVTDTNTPVPVRWQMLSAECVTAVFTPVYGRSATYRASRTNHDNKGINC